MNNTNVIIERKHRLQALMRQYGMDAYLILSDDFHGSEYVGDYFKSREYMSGFDGSAGMLLILAEKDQMFGHDAFLWTDGRYFLQAQEQLKDSDIFLMKQGEDKVPTISGYMALLVKERLAKEPKNNKFVLGADGRCVSKAMANQIAQEIEPLVPYQFISHLDLMNELWENRPALSAKNAWLMQESQTGESRRTRLHLLKAELLTENVDAFLLSSLDQIAWLYLLRGGDIDYNPVVLSYSLITRDKAYLYANSSVFSSEVLAELNKDGIEILPYDQIYEDLKKIPANWRVWVDENHTNYQLLASISPQNQLFKSNSPIIFWKSIKTRVEQEMERKAHLKDGIAVTKFLYWLDQPENQEKIRKGELTECAASDQLLAFRKMQEGFIDQSFAPIFATGAHGAIIHYEPTPETQWPIQTGTFLLMDTGGHYLEGTTDITRTVLIGEGTKEQKRHYTAVLRGNLNLGKAVFLDGMTGANLDILARMPLFEMGLNFNHGTGHGVGFLLNVHEGPQSIRYRGDAGKLGTALSDGMITSNEPGVYFAGAYGIRLENMTVVKTKEKTELGWFHTFETLTLVPFDRNAILSEEMTNAEIDCLNQYHARVYQEIGPFLTEKELEWLRQKTLPIG